MALRHSRKFAAWACFNRGRRQAALIRHWAGGGRAGTPRNARGALPPSFLPVNHSTNKTAPLGLWVASDSFAGRGWAGLPPERLRLLGLVLPSQAVRPRSS